MTRYEVVVAGTVIATFDYKHMQWFTQQIVCILEKKLKKMLDN